MSSQKWKAAKKKFETATGKKKPGEKFLKRFRKKSGIEAAMAAVEAAKTPTAAVAAYGKLVAKARAYRELLKQAAQDAEDASLKKATEELRSDLYDAMTTVRANLAKPKSFEDGLKDKVCLEIWQKVDADFLEFYTKWLKPGKITAKTIGHIYTEFIDAKGSKCLNLPSSTRKRLFDHLQKVNIPALVDDVKGKAANEIVNIFMGGTFVDIQKNIDAYADEAFAYGP